MPQGWYSEPWWRPALIGGAWGLGSVLLFSTMFGGMAGVPSEGEFAQGLDTGQEGAGDMGGGDGGDGGDMGDAGGSGDYSGGFDSGGFDGGGF